MVFSASPWAEVGDVQLRSDLQILAIAGVIDDITTHWPIPWAGIVSDVRREDALSGQPAYVREAARRVLKKAGQQMHFDDLRASATIDATNLPDVVRGFDAMNLAQGEAQAFAATIIRSKQMFFGRSPVKFTAIRLAISGTSIPKLSWIATLGCHSAGIALLQL